jgi:hypothetical protein
MFINVHMYEPHVRTYVGRYVSTYVRTAWYRTYILYLIACAVCTACAVRMWHELWSRAG